MAGLPTDFTLVWNTLRTAGKVLDILKGLRDGVSNKDPFLTYLTAQCKEDHDGSEFITSAIKNKKGKAKWSSGNRAFGKNKHEYAGMARWPMGKISEAAYYNWDDKLMNASKERVFNFIEENLNYAKAAIQHAISLALYGTDVLDVNGATQDDVALHGLQNQVPDVVTSGTSGNITRDATAATDFWKSNSYDAAGPITKALIRKAVNASTHMDQSPNIMTCGDEVFESLQQVAEQGKWLYQNQKAIDMGFPNNIDFAGIPIIPTKYLTASTGYRGELDAASGRLYILNTGKESMSLKINPNDDMRTWDPIRIPGEMTWEQPVTHGAQLLVKTPWLNSVIFGITTTT